MKLIAIKWISDYLPAGAAFDIPEVDAAQTLIESGYARADDSESLPVAAAPSSRRSYRRRDLEAEP